MAYQLLINGALVDGANTLDVINPASGEVFAQCARADNAQLEQAIAGAKSAFPAWSALSFAERRVKLEAFADAIDARKDEFAQVLTAEQGKPLGDAAFEMMLATGLLRYFASQSLSVETIRDNENEHILRQRVPLGVIAAIVPWNFPILLLMSKIAPALTVGNTLIAKPAPTTPLTTLMLGEIAADIFPAGVFSTIVDNNDLGSVMTSHDDIAKVSFTGSTATGKKVVKSASETLKRMTMELGGNDAAIVLDDIDAKTAAEKVFHAATVNCGQVCMAAKRIYVPASMYDDVCKELVSLANAAVVGDGTDPETQIGPIQNAQQFEKVKGFLANAHEDGTVIAGGEALDRPGYFIAPTIVRDIAEDSLLVTEEQFAPILPVLSYDSLDDVIERANDSVYGLAGTVWTGSSERGVDVALKMHTGTIWVNHHLVTPFDVAIGGAKQSGFGVEFGEESMHEYTQAKTINVAVA